MKTEKRTDDFYIGWMPSAPTGITKRLRKWLFFLLIIVAITGILLALLQKPFSTGNFEFGQLTTVKGVYSDKPFASLTIHYRNDIFNRPVFITVPLIGAGKMGAAPAIKAVEKQHGSTLNGKEVSLKGTLLYNNGKLLIQIDSSEGFLVGVGAIADPHLIPAQKDLGERELHGEIVDPKCFFGVMKPGQGKPHKDCAIRCILGGIPPCLKVTDKDGNENYYLITGENGTLSAEAVKKFVAAPVSLRGKLLQYGDWMVLSVRPDEIRSYSYLREQFGDNIDACVGTTMK